MSKKPRPSLAHIENTVRSHLQPVRDAEAIAALLTAISEYREVEDHITHHRFRWHVVDEMNADIADRLHRNNRSYAVDGKIRELQQERNAAEWEAAEYWREHLAHRHNA